MNKRKQAVTPSKRAGENVISVHVVIINLHRECSTVNSATAKKIMETTTKSWVIVKTRHAVVTKVSSQ